MSEYRLKKKYPGLPQDWKVDMLVGTGDGKIYYRPCDSKYTVVGLHPDDMEGYPEFWEKVKEYPVGTVVEDTLSINKGARYKKGENGWNTKGWTEQGFENRIGTRFNVITPIFKTSDGVDMFVGDTCYIVGYQLGVPSKCVCWQVDQRSTLPILAFSTQELAQKFINDNKPKVLFKTHDGAEIIGKDVPIYTCLKVPTPGEEIIYYKAGDFLSHLWPNRLAFLNREACRRYINENKPVYSQKNLKDFFEIAFANHHYLGKEELFKYAEAGIQ